jgi:hypothetical protein
MLAISFLTAASSVFLYVRSVHYRAWAACWSFGLTLLVFGVVAVVMLARVLRPPVNPGEWDGLDLVLCLLFMAGSFYYHVVGVHYEDRALEGRGSGVLGLLCGGRVPGEDSSVRARVRPIGWTSTRST